MGGNLHVSRSALLAITTALLLLSGCDLGPTPRPTEMPTPSSYGTLDERGWQLLVKAPDEHKGEGYQVWGCITQFDTNTGADEFRAQASHAREVLWYSEGTNAMFRGDKSALSPFVKGDVVLMKVQVLGTTTYVTAEPKLVTAPFFKVIEIAAEGRCA